MKKEKLNSLLDSIYELEGLVHLALSRDDSPEALPGLIVRKGKELAKLSEAVALEEEETAAEEPLTEDESEEIDTFEQEVEAEADVDPEAEPEVEVELVYDDEPADDEPADEEPEDYFEPEPEPEYEPEVEEKPKPEPKQQGGFEPRGRLVFSINDRYRFKRELFSGSDADFNNTLALVASMDNYDEAEDYFLGDLQWDPTSQDVTDFLEILKRYFK